MVLVGYKDKKMRYIALLLLCAAEVMWGHSDQGILGTHCQVSEYLVDCSFQNRTNIPADLPQNISCLNMIGNDLSQISENIWQRYQNLSKLSLARNRITALHKRDFVGLQKLKMLDLSLNMIRYNDIHENAFKPLRSLVFLDIKQNLPNISKNEFYPQGLKHLIQLQTLAIDGLGTQTLPFLPNLTELYMSGKYGRCNVSRVKESLFGNIKNVQKMFLSECFIRHVEFDSFLALQNITSLDMSGNIHLGMESVPNITSGLQNKTEFKRLNLNTLYNHSQFDFCSSLSYDDIKYLSDAPLEMLTIENNNLVRMDIDTVKHWPKSLKYISVQHNMFLFGNYTPYLKNTSALSNVVYFDVSRMAASNRPIYEGVDTVQTLSSQASCKNMFTRYQVGDYFETIEKRLKQNDINTVTNDNLESKLEYLDISENLPVLIERIFEIFPSIPNLKVLNVSRNYLGYPLYDGSGIIGQLKNLRTLDLSDNKIIQLMPNVFNNLTKLKHLYLSHNKISNITFNLSNLKSLKFIDLRDNILENINFPSRNALDKLQNVTINISKNKLKCTCENIEFLNWVKRNKKRFVDLPGTICSLKNSESVSLTKLNYDQLKTECSKSLAIVLVTSIAFLFMIVVITSALIYRFRWNLRYMYYMTKLKFMDNYQRFDETDFEKEVFVSYADEDRRFVVEQVCLELEEKGEISLLIHDRDFRAGEYVQDNILRAISSTRRTLIILTKHFLKSKWCMYELNMARMEAADTGRNILCFVLMETISATDLPLEVIDALKRVTYMEYPSSNDNLSEFWNRLRATLQHNG